MGAAYNSRDRNPAPRCLAGTWKEVLDKIEKWVRAGSEGTSILWLHGPAGAGKSAIAQTVAETCAERGELAASFFFARIVAGRNALKYLFPTIAAQIALWRWDLSPKYKLIFADSSSLPSDLKELAHRPMPLLRGLRVPGGYASSKLVPAPLAQSGEPHATTNLMLTSILEPSLLTLGDKLGKSDNHMIVS